MSDAATAEPEEFTTQLWVCRGMRLDRARKLVQHWSVYDPDTGTLPEADRVFVVKTVTGALPGSVYAWQLTDGDQVIISGERGPRFQYSLRDHEQAADGVLAMVVDWVAQDRAARVVQQSDRLARKQEEDPRLTAAMEVLKVYSGTLRTRWERAAFAAWVLAELT